MSGSSRDRIQGASPLRRLYRRLRPIPTSPRPRSAVEAYQLNLVPQAALTARLQWAINHIAGEAGGEVAAYLEFGVYNGSSMICMHRALESRGLVGVRLVGFDSFRGLPPDIGEVDDGVWLPGQFACPRSVTEANLRAAGIPDRDLLLVEGWYKETLASGPQALGLARASIVMIDCDAYPSAKLALGFIAPILDSPSILIFDDWKLNELDLKGMGEYRAFKEFLRTQPDIRAKEVKSYNRKSKMFVVRRRG